MFINYSPYTTHSGTVNPVNEPRQEYDNTSTPKRPYILLLLFCNPHPRSEDNVFQLFLERVEEEEGRGKEKEGCDTDTEQKRLVDSHTLPKWGWDFDLQPWYQQATALTTEKHTLPRERGHIL